MWHATRCVIMRALALTSILFAACAATPTATPSPDFTSVKARLEQQPTRLFIGGAGSSGSLVAQRYTSDGWVSGTATIAISSGELVASITGDQLKANTFDVALDPIDVPESVFGKPAQLRDVKITLAEATSASATWTDDNNATATLPLKLDLTWSIAINNGVSQLGTQHLPLIPLDLALTGAGDHVDATLGLHGAGDLWSWAGLVELSQLDLSLVGATVDQ